MEKEGREKGKGGEAESCLFRRATGRKREREVGAGGLASVSRERLGVGRACLIRGQSTQVTGHLYV